MDKVWFCAIKNGGFFIYNDWLHKKLSGNTAIAIEYAASDTYGDCTEVLALEDINAAALSEAAQQTTTPMPGQEPANAGAGLDKAKELLNGVLNWRGPDGDGIYDPLRQWIIDYLDSPTPGASV